MTELAAELILLGIIAGTLAGLLGIGGGIVVVPSLLWLFDRFQLVPPDHAMHFALGTSLATICFTSLASVRAHHKRGAVLWDIVLKLSPGLVIGTLMGAQIAERMTSRKLAIGFAVFLIVVSLQVGLRLQPKTSGASLKAWLAVLLGLFIGTISALVGIGGGTLTVPLLMWFNVPIRVAVATSAAGGIFISAAGTLGFLLMGSTAGALGEGGYIYWPAVAGIVPASLVFAPLGARLTHALPVGMLKTVFALFLFVVGTKLFIQNFPKSELGPLLEAVYGSMTSFIQIAERMLEVIGASCLTR